MKSAFAFAALGLWMGSVSASAEAVDGAAVEMELCQNPKENSVIRAANCDLALRLGGLSRDQMIVAHYNRGQSALVAEQAENALADFEAVLKLSPTDKEALFGRAVCQRRLKQFDRALADFDALVAQKFEPAAKVYMERGMTHFMAGDTEKSLADLRRARELAPTDQLIADRLWKTERVLQLQGK